MSQPVPAVQVPVVEGLRFEGIPEVPQVGRDATKKILALAHLRGPAMSESMEASRPPVRISAVVDRSGSMGGERLALVQRTLAFVVRELTAKDEFGIVAYDDTTSENLPLTKMSPAGKRTAQLAIDALHTGGCTNLSGGLLAGIDQAAGRAFTPSAPEAPFAFPFQQQQQMPMQQQMFSNALPPPFMQFQQQQQPVFQAQQQQQQQMQCQQQQQPVFQSQQLPMQQLTPPPMLPPVQHTDPFAELQQQPPVEEKPKPAKNPPAQGTVSAVWLFTDGQANCGITDTSGIVRAMQSRLSGLQATSVFTFGYGRDHNEAMLRAIAEAANGMYYFIDTPESIPGAFAECLGGVLSVVAQDLRVEVRAAQDVKMLRVLGRTDAVTEGDSALLVLQDLYAEEERDLLFELQVSPSAGEVLAHLRVTFTDAQTGAKRQAEAAVRVGRPDKCPAKQPTHPRLDEQRNRIRTTEALAQARKQADAGDLEAARKTLSATKEYVTASVTGANACNADLLEDINDAIRVLESRGTWEQQGRKYMMQTEACHMQQRSSGMQQQALPGAFSTGSKDRYTNFSQQTMKQKAASHFK